MATKYANAFFLLSENVSKSLQLGIIGHLKEMDDIPPVGKFFLICDSLRKVVLGPFVVTREQHESAVPVIFVRRIGGSETEDKYCHWLFGFAKASEIEESELGLSLEAASDSAGIPRNWWASVRQNRMDDEQFEALCLALIEANQAQVPPEGAVAFSSYFDEDMIAEDMAAFYGEPVARYSEDGDPMNRQAFIDLLFGGDERAYESNWGDD